MSDSGEKPLYLHQGKPLTAGDFKNALATAGVSAGDTIFVHSDLAVFGRLPGPDRDFSLPRGLIGVLTESVGNGGNVILPTFTYSFCKNEVFDVEKTRSTVGALPEFFRRQPGVQRSLHPLFSAACWGQDSSDILDVSRDSFGAGSIFDKVYRRDGKIVFFGAPFQSCTFVHYAEQAFGIPYRYMKKFKGVIKNGGRETESEVDYFVRRLDFDTATNFKPLENSLEQKGLLKRVPLGAGEIAVVKAKDLFDETLRMLGANVHLLLKNPPPPYPKEAPL